MSGWPRFLIGLLAGLLLGVIFVLSLIRGEPGEPGKDATKADGRGRKARKARKVFLAESPTPLPVDPETVRVKIIAALSMGGGEAMVLLAPQETAEEGAEPEFAGKVLPIYIGIFEAIAIQRELDGKKARRPMTHDLLRNTIRDLGCRVERVTVTEIKGRVYHARISILRADGSRVEIDARPSDSMALATRVKVPIYVSRQVMEQAGKEPGKLQPATEPPATEIFF